MGRNPELGSRQAVSASGWRPRMGATQCFLARSNSPMRSTGSPRTNQRTEEVAAHPLGLRLAAALLVHDDYVPFPALGLVCLGERVLQAANTVGIKLICRPARCCSPCACRLALGNQPDALRVRQPVSSCWAVDRQIARA